MKLIQTDILQTQCLKYVQIKSEVKFKLWQIKKENGVTKKQLRKRSVNRNDLEGNFSNMLIYNTNKKQQVT